MTWAHAPWTTALCQSMVDSWWHRDKSSPKLSPQDATASESSPMVGKIQERGGGDADPIQEAFKLSQPDQYSVLL
jgi:hypothetical protein